MVFKTHEEIDKYYEKKDLETKEYNRLFSENHKILSQAISNVKKTKFLSGFFYYPNEGSGRLTEEVDLEWSRLSKINEKNKLDCDKQGEKAI